MRHVVTTALIGLSLALVGQGCGHDTQEPATPVTPPQEMETVDETVDESQDEPDPESDPSSTWSAMSVTVLVFDRETNTERRATVEHPERYGLGNPMLPSDLIGPCANDSECIAAPGGCRHPFARLVPVNAAPPGEPVAPRPPQPGPYVGQCAFDPSDNAEAVCREGACILRLPSPLRGLGPTITVD